MNNYNLTEYTKEEIDINGNGVYGGRIHDQICDQLQRDFNFSEEQINDISMGIWKGIELEKIRNDIELIPLKSFKEKTLVLLDSLLNLDTGSTPEAIDCIKANIDRFIEENTSLQEIYDATIRKITKGINNG